MTLWIILAITFFLMIALVLGYLSLKKQLRKHISINNFAVEYYENYLNFLESRLEGESDYNMLQWLILNSDKMQRQMKHTGVVDYKDAYQGLIIRNYPIILNEVPKLTDRYLDEYTKSGVPKAILRYIGICKTDYEVYEELLKNPLNWISEGIAQLFAFPLYLLKSFGIIGSSTVSNVISSTVFRIGSGIVTLITIISGLVTIFQGYDQSKQFLFKRIPALSDSTKASSDTIKKVMKPNAATIATGQSLTNQHRSTRNDTELKLNR
jgi:hypothetical protein